MNNDNPSFIILSVLDIEHRAILERLCYRRKEEILNSTWASLDPGNNSPKGIAVKVPAVGRIEAAVIVSRALGYWQPEVLILVGLSGGFEGNGVSCGDVLVATEILDFELQKLVKDRSEIRWREFTPSTKLINIARHTAQRDPFSTYAIKPRVHFGPLFSGEKVIASRAFSQELQTRHKGVLGVEMEGSGVATALRYHDVEFLMIRGVADMADENKSDSHQEIASDVAADFAIAVLQDRFRIQPPRP